MDSTLSDRALDRLRRWTLKMVGAGAADRLAAIARPANEYGVDSFGFSIDWALGGLAPFVALYKHYFRVKTHGIENVPAGKVLIVSNHAGQLPFDGAMIGTALLVEANPPRPIRSMVEKWVPTLPYVSTFMARMGQIVGTQENCRRLLAGGEAILVFPEGARGIGKLFRDRYQLQEFGLGFMRLALETGAPILPVAVIGSEEQSPALANLKPLARLFGLPNFPITPTLLPFPLPARYTIRFGKPMRFTGSPNDEDAELESKVKTVRGAIQAMINQGLKERRSIFL